jgi:hypothetical protein
MLEQRTTQQFDGREEAVNPASTSDNADGYIVPSLQFHCGLYDACVTKPP